MSDEQLKLLGVSRTKDRFGKTQYLVPCAICGTPVGMRVFTTEKIIKCEFCKKEIAKRRKAKVEAAREELLTTLAEELETDYTHLKRFEKGTTKFGKPYYDAIDVARKAIDKFDSVPEVVACIELVYIGARFIVHQKVGDFTVDFCLPKEKVVIEIDGSLYHADADSEAMRDYAIKNMLGDGWIVRHIPSDAVMRNHTVFGTAMKRMLNNRRRDLMAS